MCGLRPVFDDHEVQELAPGDLLRFVPQRDAPGRVGELHAEIGVQQAEHIHGGHEDAVPLIFGRLARLDVPHRALVGGDGSLVIAEDVHVKGGEDLRTVFPPQMHLELAESAPFAQRRNHRLELLVWE